MHDLCHQISDTGKKYHHIKFCAKITDLSIKLPLYIEDTINSI